ncbi:MAG: hypothetical protein E7327_04580 [Clostridiales bacterium]|nr:hypothetical protein [Clostridiales bacterium]
MMRRILIALAIITVLVLIGSAIGRNIPSSAFFARVQADDAGVQVEFFLANSAMVPYQFSSKVQNRTLKIDLRASVFGEYIGDSFRIDIPPSAYDDIVIRCNSQLVTVQN